MNMKPNQIFYPGDIITRDNREFTFIEYAKCEWNNDSEAQSYCHFCPGKHIVEPEQCGCGYIDGEPTYTLVRRAE